MMWQEARKQEKKIRGMLVDYKKRAERRKDYYEKIKAEPTQFIQLHGRPCKIHLDPAVAIAGDSPANMMSWQGNSDILIDRFDVRAHLDHIPETKRRDEEAQEDEPSAEERLINYERYRILAQNDFLAVTEDKFLHQLAIEEQFGPVEKTEPQPIEGKKKVAGAAIGYNYSEGGAASSPGTGAGAGAGDTADNSDDDKSDEDDDDSDIDFDLCVDVNKISSSQAHEMNAAAITYGMVGNDFFSFLTKDVEEAENLKLAREREEEKAMFSGRKSRRERRAFREKKLVGRKLSPPSYAASKEHPIADLIRHVAKARSRTRSRSASPPNAGMIQYITSFGGDETPLEPPPPQIIKTSVHSSKEADTVYKRTVRYKSSRSPELAPRRCDPERGQRPGGGHRGAEYRCKSPGYHRRSRSRSVETRMVRYRSRSPAGGQGRNNDRLTGASYRRRQSHSRSRSYSPPTTRIVKKSTSPQPIIQRSVEVPAPPVITRYYGRRKNDSSSSELDLSDSEDKNDKTDKSPTSDKNSLSVGNAGGRSKPAPASQSQSAASLQERLKKKRQALINRQFKADKRAERLRQEKAEQERQDREDEMREMSIKMRRRERQKRHQYYDLDESNSHTGEGDRSDEDQLSSASSSSIQAPSDSEQRSKVRSSRKSRDQDPEKTRRSRERDRSRETDRSRERSREKERSRELRRESEVRRDRDRSGERDRRPIRREDERYRGKDQSRERKDTSRDQSRERGRDRSRERERDRSRDKERKRRDRERGRDRSRERYSSHRGREQDDSNDIAIKKPFRPLVDY